jgi:uncharacterized protein YjiS (DUF1127 family)
MTISVRTKCIHAECQPKPRSLWRRFTQSFALRRQRQHLGNLDEHLLEDIGVTQAAAFVESRKSAWDVPEHWHK